MGLFIFLLSSIPSLCVERLVEFRDGTILKIDVPDMALKFNANGDHDASDQIIVRLSKAAQITFSELPPLKRVERITEALNGLRDESFATREKSALSLTKFAQGFRGLLESRLEKSFDPEIKWRLRRVLEQLPFYAIDEYDHVRFGNRSLKGEFDVWQLNVKYQGAVIELSRATVKSITALNPRNQHEMLVVRNASDSRLPLNCRKIDFERYPTGKALKAGENIQEAFMDWGVSFSTSVENSYVSVNHYHIEGSGGGKAAATHSPLYEGSITLRFFKPGDQTRAAGVNFVGCWLGIVKPGGTFMVAYDVNGREIGRAVSADGKSQFLGVKSAVPIARLEIVPNPEIDSSFALDDLIYEQPSPLLGADNASHFSITLINGNKINCSSINPIRENGTSVTHIAIKPGLQFSEEIQISLNKVKLLVPPIMQRVQRKQFQTKVWARLWDGSQISLHSPPEGGLAPTLGSMDLNKLNICTLWASRRELQNPPKNLIIPEGGAAIIMRNDPLYLLEYKLGGEKFSGLREDGSTVSYSYNRLPTVWIEKPSTEKHAKGRIELHDGQILHFGKECIFQTCNLDAGAITARVYGAEPNQGKPIQIDFGSISSVRFY